MSLTDRVREALAPSLRVERELGCGAMAVVYLGKDPALDRHVAIKVLRPEVATAVAVKRFLREGQLLARLRHPNIIQVHQAGNVQGLLYYVMDYAAGETLADRLDRGPLTPEEAVRVALDVLDALTAAHKLGIVHRDVKPGNVFLDEGRAYLADFGIAKTPSGSETDPGITMEGGLIGTRAYMTPEQLSGAPATTASDIYATGLLCYEALTGRLWTPMQAPEDADWSGIPPRIAQALRGALALDRTKRWPTAEAMRKALAGVPARTQWRLALVAGALVVGTVALVLFRGLRPLPTTSQGQVVAIAGFEASQADREVADSLAGDIAFVLRGAPDFEVHWPSRGSRDRAWLRLTGTLQRVNDSIVVQPRLEIQGSPRHLGRVAAPIGRRSLLVDGITTELLVQILRGQNEWIPTGAVPRTSQGLYALIPAERAYFQAQRDSAARLYLEAFAVDTTCVLCLYRYNDLLRYLGEEPESAHVAIVRREIERFPSRYRALIAAEQLPNPARLHALENVTRDHLEFPDGWYRYGEELYNRGPLWGRDRYHALAIFRSVPGARPELAPPSGFDVAALHIAKGDTAAARRAIDRFGRYAGTARDQARLVLAEVAFAMRFVSLDSGVSFTRSGLRRRGVAELTEVAAGPRMLHAFDLPDGAVALGEVYETRDDRPLWVTSGRIAQVTGHAALGQLRALDPVRSRLERSGEPSSVTGYPIFLHALLVTFDDSNEARAGRTSVESTLPGLDLAPDNDRWTAGWILAVMAYRLGDTTAAKRRQRYLGNEPAPQRRRSLVEGWQAAARHDYAQALRLTDSLVLDLRLMEGDTYGDRFLRAGVKLSRAEWLMRARLLDSARNELRWHQHVHLPEYPIGDPLSAETDWALGTFARWRLVTWLGEDTSEEVCRAREAVARHWKQGDSPYRERARLVGESFRKLCPPVG